MFSVKFFLQEHCREKECDDGKHQNGSNHRCPHPWAKGQQEGPRVHLRTTSTREHFDHHERNWPSEFDDLVTGSINGKRSQAEVNILEDGGSLLVIKEV
ncbi:hypothetical protein E2C01_051265 [Portunus trituberculatus]|uniref:Uncharacterized protein n=1 Tax=Portunus trituberculatus TaxID=210409 RepID=A0A5B7GJU2_PORTR|nr:hypothetical protein [Portunus trituberculatus]